MRSIVRGLIGVAAYRPLEHRMLAQRTTRGRRTKALRGACRLRAERIPHRQVEPRASQPVAPAMSQQGRPVPLELVLPPREQPPPEPARFRSEDIHAELHKEPFQAALPSILGFGHEPGALFLLVSGEKA